ncbi:MAG: MOSC domain-containing protein [Thermomicrobiales bacterium]
MGDLGMLQTAKTTMRQVGVLSTVQVGTPRRYQVADVLSEADRSWRTSFFRVPSPDRRRLHMTHLEGNQQADTKNHGGAEQAVLMYSAAHYAVWQAELGRSDIGPGGFGENFTIEELTEATACIGDIYQVGDARIQVSGPRYPCVKISRRWGIDGLTERVGATGRTGWYCRVLQEGEIEPGMSIVLVDRPFPQYSIALINDFTHHRNHDLDRAHELAACPLLPEWWQRLVVARASGREW